MSSLSQPLAPLADRTAKRADLVRRVYRAYESGDRTEIELLLSDDFTFTSPYDDHIDRAAYFERCWPGAGTFRHFELHQVTVDSDACFVMYTAERMIGGKFHNTERFEFTGDQIRSVEVFFGLPPAIRPERTPADEIRTLLERRRRALRDRDAAGVIALYARDAFAFGLAPPLRITAAQLHDPRQLESWFATWSGPIETELRDFEIRAGADIGTATALQRLSATATSGARTELWMRMTYCFCKEDGRWKIASAHESVPFAMDGSYRALVHLAPDRDGPTGECAAPQPAGATTTAG
jgi:ketosteroid isomerase-like protein